MNPVLTHAFEVCEKSEEYINYETLSDEEKKNVIEPLYCKDPNKNDPFKSLDYKLKASLSDSSYNSASAGFVTSPKWQGVLGTCWSFAAIGAVESNALKNGLQEYDFSDSHMIFGVLAAGYSDELGKYGKYYTEDLNGGSITYASSYYFNNGGQVFESEMPYSDTNTLISSSQYPMGKKIIELSFPQPVNYPLIPVKKALHEYILTEELEGRLPC